MSKLVVALRIALGGVFVYAAYTKLRQPWLVFAMSIDSYRMLPAWAVFTVARTLPWLELAIGVLLLIGAFARYVAPAATALLVVFYAAMYHAYLTGSGIDCGCFGVGEAVSAATLTRDGLLLASAILLSVLTRKGRPERHDSPETPV